MLTFSNVLIALFTIYSVNGDVAFPFIPAMGFILFGLAVGSDKKGLSAHNSFSLGEAHRLSQANYSPRILGFAGSFLLIALLVISNDWSNWFFLYMSIYFLIYPHLVLLVAKIFPEKKKVEVRAMMFDAFMLGIWTAHIHFSLWISFAFLTSTVLNHIMVGGHRQLLKGLGLFLFGTIIGGLMTGFRMELEAAFHIELLAMAALLSYIFSSAGIFYKQTRRLAEIRVELENKNEILNDTVQELENTRNELVEKAHKAGMADIASGILHNVGNILNSVTTSASLIKDTVKKSKVEGLEQANTILREHINHIEEFISNDPKGKKLMHYYLKIEEPLKEEQHKVIKQSNRLIDKIEMINSTIAAQQNYVGARMHDDHISLSEIVEDALALQAGSIERHELKIKKDFQPVDEIEAHRSKLVHVLINIIKNAKEAMKEVNQEDKKLEFSTWQDSEMVYLSIMDNGEGIKEENKTAIFKHGFTTKKEGHGFGLHSSANYMTEMGGKIKVNSDGNGKGTTFILSFPRKKKNTD